MDSGWRNALRSLSYRRRVATLGISTLKLHGPCNYRIARTRVHGGHQLEVGRVGDSPLGSPSTNYASSTISLRPECSDPPRTCLGRPEVSSSGLSEISAHPPCSQRFHALGQVAFNQGTSRRTRTSPSPQLHMEHLPHCTELVSQDALLRFLEWHPDWASWIPSSLYTDE